MELRKTLEEAEKALGKLQKENKELQLKLKNANKSLSEECKRTENVKHWKEKYNSLKDTIQSREASNSEFLQLKHEHEILQQDFNLLQEQFDKISNLEQFEVATDVSLEEMRELIASSNICVCGGHQNTTGRIREMFPNWKYIGFDDFSTMSVSNLKHYEVVVVMLAYCGHGLYYKVKNNIASDRLLLINIGNIDLITQLIYNKLVS